MKMFIKVGIVAFFSLSLTTVASAGHKNTHMANNAKWVCETNASSASTDADKKADESMKKTNSGKSAFNFALQHCRDCTKITCTTENQ